MSSYYVQVNADFYKGYSVEADSEEEALEIAKENFEYDYSSDWDSLDMKAEEFQMSLKDYVEEFQQTHKQIILL